METQTKPERTRFANPAIQSLSGNIGRFRYEEHADVLKGREQGGVVYWFPEHHGVEMENLIIGMEYSEDRGITSFRSNEPVREIPVDYAAQVIDCAVRIVDFGDSRGTTLGIYNIDDKKRQATLKLLEEAFG